MNGRSFGLLMTAGVGALFLACPQSPASREVSTTAPEAWAVGTTIGGRSSTCTYSAPPAVAELTRHHETGAFFMAKLTGPGRITETCSRKLRIYEVLTPTQIRIDGPSLISIAPTEPTTVYGYRVTPLSRERELRGIRQGGHAPVWTLGADCDGIATFAPVLGAQDTGGADITRRLLASRAGTCTLHATALGLSASKTVRIR